MFLFWKSKADRQREGEQILKLESGQRAMQSALESTTEAADGLLEWFRQEAAKTNDAADTVEDALLLCDTDGVVARGNVGATVLFHTNTIHHSIKDFLTPEIVTSSLRHESLFVSKSSTDLTWSQLFSNPPKSKISMIAQRDNGDRFPVDVAITRIDHLIDAPKLLFLIRDPSAPKKNIFETLTSGVDQARATFKERAA